MAESVYSTVKISECLVEFGIQMTPNELKKIKPDDLLKIYSVILEAFDYTQESWTGPGNFEAVSELGNSEEFNEIVPFVNFGLIINNILQSAGIEHVMLTHYNLHEPKWKVHRIMISLLLFFEQYLRELKIVYQEVCQEYAQKKEEKAKTMRECKELELKHNELSVQLAHKKFGNDLNEVVILKGQELAAISAIREEKKEEFNKVKQAVDEEAAENARLLAEIEEEDRLFEELNGDLITDETEQQKEMQELQSKLEKLQKEVKYLDDEKHQFDNKSVVDSNPSSNIQALFQASKEKFQAFIHQVQVLESKLEDLERVRGKRVSVENQLKQGTAAKSQLKEDLFNLKSSEHKKRLQLIEQLKDKKGQLAQLQADLEVAVNKKKAQSETEAQYEERMRALTLKIQEAENKIQIAKEEYQQVVQMVKHWEEQTLAENAALRTTVNQKKRSIIEEAENKVYSRKLSTKN